MNKTLTALLCLSQLSVSLYADLLGAGATFPYPLYNKLFKEFSTQNNTRINYQAIGSGGGVRQLKSKLIDFAATDAYLQSQDLISNNNKILHIPICSGGVALSFNIPGVTSLRLSPDVIGDIFIGKITSWNNTKIRQLNPGVNLPNLDIVPIQRSDSSGTTYILSDYLSKTSVNFAQKFKASKIINWPKGVSGKGNAGVASLTKQIPGALGYISSVYGHQNNLLMASIRNSSGNYIYPNVEAITEASEIILPDDTRASITNTSNPKGYPISGFTWIILYKNQNYDNRSIETTNELFKLINWMISEGQDKVATMHYSPLSKNSKEKAAKVLNKISFMGKKVNIQN